MAGTSNKRDWQEIQDDDKYLNSTNNNKFIKIIQEPLDNEQKNTVLSNKNNNNNISKVKTTMQDFEEKLMEKILGYYLDDPKISLQEKLEKKLVCKLWKQIILNSVFILHNLEKKYIDQYHANFKTVKTIDFSKIQIQVINEDYNVQNLNQQISEIITFLPNLKNIVINFNNFFWLYKQQDQCIQEILGSIFEQQNLRLDSVTIFWNFEKKVCNLVNLGQLDWFLETYQNYLKNSQNLSTKLLLNIGLGDVEGQQELEEFFDLFIDYNENINLQYLYMKIYLLDNWYEYQQRIAHKIENIKIQIQDFFVEFDGIVSFYDLEDIYLSGNNFVDLNFRMRLDSWSCKEWSQNDINMLNNNQNLKQFQLFFSPDLLNEKLIQELKNFFGKKRKYKKLQFDPKTIAQNVTDLYIETSVDIIKFFKDCGHFFTNLKYLWFSESRHGTNFLQLSDIKKNKKNYNQILENFQNLQTLEIGNCDVQTFQILNLCTNLKKLNIHDVNDKNQFFTEIKKSNTFLPMLQNLPLKQFKIKCGIEFEQTVINIIENFKQLEKLHVEFFGTQKFPLQFQNYHILSQLKNLKKLKIEFFSQMARDDDIKNFRENVSQYIQNIQKIKIQFRS